MTPQRPKGNDLSDQPRKDPMPLNRQQAEAMDPWVRFVRNHNLRAFAPDWRASTAVDGLPCWSAEVAGLDATAALRAFAGDTVLMVSGPDDLRPVFDYSTPGRVACVWRSGGVWVELWHPDTRKALVTPPAARTSTRAGSPSGRLPFGRTRLLYALTATPKEI